MKKILLGCVISIMLVLPITVFASPACTDAPSTTLCNPIRFSQDDIGVFAFKVVATASTFFTLIAVIFVVYSGFRMIISQGNEEELTAAKSSLQWALSGLVLALFAFVIIYATASYLGAKNLEPNSYIGDKPLLNPLADDTFAKLLVRFLTGFLSIVGILAILMIIVGGFRYVTSAGNEEQAEAGKKTLQWAIIGLVIALLSYVLVRATLTFFGG